MKPANSQNRIVSLFAVLAATIGVTTTLLSALATHAWLPAPTTTDVSGPITSDTTWTLAGSPYILTADVTITAGVTLTIEPGVVVMGQSNTVLGVAGHLEAVGTSESPVTFTSTSDSSPGQWTSICVGGSAHFDQAEFRYSQFSLDIWGPTGGEVFVENSAITSSTQYGLWTYPDSIHRLRMADVVFSDNVRNRVLIDTQYQIYALAEDTTLTAQPGLEGYEFNAPQLPILQFRPGLR